MQSWTCDWELVEYWDKVIADKSLTDKYFRELKEDLANFKIDIRGENIADIGAGAFGGVFSILDFQGNKTMIDPCATEFKKRYNKIPDNIKLVDGYANNIPASDCQFDTIFCIETLDHCNSVEEYKASAKEIVRVLAKMGTLYFMIPLRQEVRDGHFITLETITVEDMVYAFSPLMVNKRIAYEHLYITGVKM